MGWDDCGRLFVANIGASQIRQANLFAHVCAPASCGSRQLKVWRESQRKNIGTIFCLPLTVCVWLESSNSAKFRAPNHTTRELAKSTQPSPFAQKMPTKDRIQLSNSLESGIRTLLVEFSQQTETLEKGHVSGTQKT